VTPIYFYRADADEAVKNVIGGKIPYVMRAFQAVPLAPFSWVAELESENVKEAVSALDSSSIGYWVSEKGEEQLDA
jgi:hypothetical protein